MSAFILAVNAYRRFSVTLPGEKSILNLIAQTGLRVLSKNDEFFRNFRRNSTGWLAISGGAFAV